MGFFDSLFGPSKDEVWGQVARDIGGDYEDGGFWGRDVLRYQLKEWTITLDTYTVSTGKSSTTYTRMRAPFVNKRGLCFKIYREGFFTPLGKLFGVQDIEIGDPFFDQSFVIQSNSEDFAKQFLADANLKQCIGNQPDICFEVRDDEGWFGADFPDGVDELRFQCYGVLRSEELLKNLFDMFCATLERLVEIDAAEAQDPGVHL